MYGRKSNVESIDNLLLHRTYLSLPLNSQPPRPLHILLSLSSWRREVTINHQPSTINHQPSIIMSNSKDFNFHHLSIEKMFIAASQLQLHLRWWTWPASFISLIIVYLLSVAIYRLYFHPLSKFPGPKSAAISDFWLCSRWYAWRSQFPSLEFSFSSFSSSVGFDCLLFIIDSNELFVLEVELY
ncbi:hypothetical protein BKA61DRAFT_177509 [Leptodontidium sp. MPI-SDFR-AT-0119]|nr:hypothetical protein BKA61DRAFT_177509 [Leptodontidium sp. MPI-SDFR-AT-0119]